MRRLIIIILTATIAVPSFGQLNLGIKAGLSTNNLRLDQTFQTDEDGNLLILQSAGEATYGFHGGMFLRLTILGVYLQPEIVLSTLENKIIITEPGEVTEQLKRQRFNKMDIPVLLGFRAGFLRINAGPAATIMLGSPKELLDPDTYENIMNIATFGYQAGVGVDLFNKVTVDLRYEGNLNTFGDEIFYDGNLFSLDQRSSSILLSLGLIF